MQRIAELREAFKNSKDYVLSHHKEDQRHRCYSVKGLDLCARCTGIYPGMAAGILATFSNPVAVAAALPAAATVEKYGEMKGAEFSNRFRTFTGLLLGIAYGAGLKELFYGDSTTVAAIGLFYGLTAIGLLNATEADLKL